MGKSQDKAELENCSDGVDKAPDSIERETPRVLLAVAATLERLVLRNEKCLVNVSDHRKLTIYHGLRPPNISILRYLERVYKYTNCSPSCLAVGFIYIDHLVHKQPDVPLISLNVHRLLVTSIMVATKLYEDVHYNNAFYARVGGISNEEINSMETDFLFRLDFRLHVSSTLFEGYCAHLEREMVLAGQRIERVLPNTTDSAMDHQHSAKQKMLQEAQRKSSLTSIHDSLAAPPIPAIESSEAPIG